MAGGSRSDDIELLRRIYAAWNAGDAGVEHFDPEFEFEQSAMFFDSARTFHGHEGLLQSGRELYSEMRDLRWDVEDFVTVSDGRVVVPFRFRATGRTSGIQTDMAVVHVWTLRDGLALRCETYEDLDAALAAAGATR